MCGFPKWLDEHGPMEYNEIYTYAGVHIQTLSLSTETPSIGTNKILYQDLDMNSHP